LVPTPPPSQSGYILTEHARLEMSRRNISEADVAIVMARPEQREIVRESRWIFQSRFDIGAPAKTYMVRVFVDIDRDPWEVVTVYRTSKVSKYWR
jgi:hypothetical protein